MRQQELDRFRSYRQVSKSDFYYLHYEPLIRDLEFVAAKYASGRLLDIGCGNKPYESMFDGRIVEYFGCDVVQSSLNRVQVICEATHIPLASRSFDTVFSTQTIEHVSDHQRLLDEAFRLLKPGGHLIISGPMYWHLHEEPYDYFRFTRYGFKYLLEKTGFTVLETLSNGGKWALLGQVILHTVGRRLTPYDWMLRLHNSLFSYLDKRHVDPYSTMNYVVVGRKGDAAASA